MKKLAFPCPCGGKIQWKRENVVIDGVDCGILDVEHCGTCHQDYFPEDSMEVIEKKLQEKGLWGIKKSVSSST